MKRDDNMTLNLKRLKAERIAKGYTQDEMAKKLGWKNRVTYAKRESGLVNLGADELAKIAEVLGYSANDLGIFFTINVPNKEQQ